MENLHRDASFRLSCASLQLKTMGSGRRELAEIIASPDNPLTARVMVNRIWQHVFGRGIVGTVDNFGVIGDKPSHPELLDYLATQFIADGWSIKKMIRSMVLSETFRQSGEIDSRRGSWIRRTRFCTTIPCDDSKRNPFVILFSLHPGNWMEPCLVRARSRTAISHRITGSFFQGRWMVTDVEAFT